MNYFPGQLLERQRGSDQPFSLSIPTFVLLLENNDYNFLVLCSTGHIILCSGAWLYFYYWEEP